MIPEPAAAHAAGGSVVFERNMAGLRERDSRNAMA